MRVTETGLRFAFDRIAAQAEHQRRTLYKGVKECALTGDEVGDAARRMIDRGTERPYGAVDPRFCSRIAGINDENQRKKWHRLLLLESVIQLRQSAGLADLPILIRHYQLVSLRRIVTLETDDCSEWLRWDSNRYQKDLGLATGALLAVGTRLAEVSSGIPRRALFAGPWASLPAKLNFIMRQGGFRPYLQTHLHDPQVERLELPDRREYWRCCALLCKAKPSLKGFIALGWIVDPALQWVTPRLYETGRIPLENGARVFSLGENPEMTRNALAASRRRRELFDQGVYRPQNCIRIWPSAALIKWAESLELQDDVPLLELDSGDEEHRASNVQSDLG